jgi:hypothetical protein
MTDITIILDLLLPDNYVFDFNISGTMRAAIDQFDLGTPATLGHSAMAGNLTLWNIDVSVASSPSWSGRVGTLTVYNVKFRSKFSRFEAASLNTDYPSYNRLRAASASVSISSLEMRDFPAGTIIPGWFPLETPNLTHARFTFSRSSSLVITSLSDTDIPHDLTIGSTCSMAYTVNGSWPLAFGLVTFEGVTFTNLNGTLSVGSFTRFAVGRIDDGSVIEVAKGWATDGIMHIRARVEIWSGRAGTVTVDDVTARSGHRMVLGNAAITLGRADRGGLWGAVLAAAGALALWDTAVIDSRRLVFVASAVPSFRGRIHDRPLRLNISLAGPKDVDLFVGGRGVDIICTDHGGWSGDECLALVFDRAHPQIALYISPLTLLGVIAVAAGVTGIVLWTFCRKAAHVPKAFEQGSGCRVDERINVDGIDQDLDNGVEE